MKTALKWLVVLAVFVGVPVALRFTVFKAKPIPVRVHRVGKGVVEETITNSRAGTVRSRHDAHLSVESAGRVTRMHFREGDAVQAGQELIDIDPTEANEALAVAERELLTLKALLSETKANLDNGQRELERNEQLLAQGAVSVEKVDQLRSRVSAQQAQVEAAQARIHQQTKAVDLTKSRVDKCKLRAPFSGVIAERLIELGEWAVPGKPVCRLVDPSDIYVRAELDEVDIARVKEGLPVRITLDPFRGRAFEGKLDRIAPYVSDVEQQNRTLEIEVTFDKPPAEGTLKPGISADVEVILESARDTLRIPAYALIDGRYVLVVEAGRAARRDVVTGLRNWEFVEIRTGLAAGDAVILTLDREDIKPGAEVAAVED